MTLLRPTPTENPHKSEIADNLARQRFTWMLNYWTENLNFPSMGMVAEYCRFASRSASLKLFRNFIKRGWMEKRGHRYSLSKQFIEVKINFTAL